MVDVSLKFPSRLPMALSLWGSRLPMAEERCQNEFGRQQIKNDLYFWPDQSLLTQLLQLIPVQTSISSLRISFYSGL